MEEDTLPPDKARVIRLLLAKEGRVMVCLDATQRGVEVPRRFGTDQGLMLVFNKTMPQPIEMLPDCIASELRFGGIPHYCVIPYTAIWSVFNPDSNHGMVWPDFMPEGVRFPHHVIPLSLEDEMPKPSPQAERAIEVPAADPPEPERKGSPVFQVIDGGGSQASVGEHLAPADPKTRRSHLRLVE